MIDFTKYNELVEEEAKLRERQREELRRIGFNDELDRLVKDRNMDCLSDISEQMLNSRLGGEKRFVYERMIQLEERQAR